jgi:hypothetical protein
MDSEPIHHELLTAPAFSAHQERIIRRHLKRLWSALAAMVNAYQALPSLNVSERQTMDALARTARLHYEELLQTR